MTARRPVVAPVPRRGRWGLLLAVAVVLGVIAWIALSGIGNALVYYQTPTELMRGDDPEAQTVRLGGLVKPGSLTYEDASVAFTLTDGTTDVPVVSDSLPTASFREGAGAVVQGQLDSGGVFRATEIIVKHDENYVAPTEGEVPSHIPDGE